MKKQARYRWWVAAGATVLVLALAGLIGVGGCGSESSQEAEEGKSTSGVLSPEAQPPAEDQGWQDARDSFSPPTTVWTGTTAPGGTATGTLSVWERAAAQKVISDAQLQIEVDEGQFQTVFAQALLLADRYGGYVVSSSSSAGGEEGTMQSGVIALRIPAVSFERALADAAALGTVKNRQIQTQDVTEEYVDLQARIVNAEAQVKALRDLMARAKTVEEILQVQQYLAVAQGDLESLRGRLRYLEEHTSFSTLTLSIYEKGVTVTPARDWGLGKALEDAVHNLVDAFNAIIRGLGVLIPVLVVLAIIGAVIYLVWRAAARRRREKRFMQYGPYPAYPQGWGAGPAPTGPGAPGGAVAPGGPAGAGSPGAPGSPAGSAGPASGTHAAGETSADPGGAGGPRA